MSGAKHLSIGLVSSLLTMGITLTDLEQWIRIAGGVGGFVILVMTIIAKGKEMRHKPQDRRYRQKH